MPVDPATVLAALNEGVYLVDRERRITYWNLAASEISGYPAQEVVGSRCADGILNHVDSAGNQLCGEHCPLQQTMQDGVSRTVQVFLHQKDGRLRPVQVTAVALTDEDGHIVGAAETFRDDSAHRADRERAAHLERLSLQDPLTGLGNRRYLDTCLATRLRQLTAVGRRFGVLMLDLDHFKPVNDTYGHETGDAALRTLACTLKLGVRPDDSVIRFGGEEFVVVTPIDDVDQLAMVAERLRELVRGTTVQATGVSLTVTVSIGATVARPGDTAAALLERADSGLLRAKRTGRDRIVLV
ncbi:MAG: sensor domain-containing diguanylate cyclase [Actinobacteria bacterium]|nr:sensor domain-containing diguanylate cyclase [Actinomycetota bacterium]MCG2801425.1 sensor domain-containing diguanylate cyclase [Cellulomonas sp.]